MSEPRFIDCLLDYVGTTTREAELVLQDGRALCSFTRFPVWVPKISSAEERRWSRGRWVIVPKKRRR